MNVRVENKGVIIYEIPYKGNPIEIKADSNTGLVSREWSFRGGVHRWVAALNNGRLYGAVREEGDRLRVRYFPGGSVSRVMQDGGTKFCGPDSNPFGAAYTLNRDNVYPSLFELEQMIDVAEALKWSFRENVLRGIRIARRRELFMAELALGNPQPR